MERWRHAQLIAGQIADFAVDAPGSGRLSKVLQHRLVEPVAVVHHRLQRQGCE